MDSSFWFIIITWDGPLYMSRCHRLFFPNINCIFSLMIIFVIANSVDCDEMPHYEALNLGLHCLPKFAVRSQ